MFADKVLVLADGRVRAYGDPKEVVTESLVADIYGVDVRICSLYDDRVRVLFCTGDTGTNVLAKTSYQANVVDMLADNVAVVDSPAGSGNGNESNLEQIATWNPDVILFGAFFGGESFFDSVASDPAWASLTAIQNGTYYAVPDEPYNWLNNPPTINQMLGMQCLARVLYPEQFEGKDTIEDVVKGYYKLFYGYDLSDAELTANSIPEGVD